MADMSTPIKNTAFTLSFTLYKNDGTIVANPGTYTKKVSVDGGAVANIAAAVTEEDTTYGQLSLVLATGEMNGDFIWVYVTDDTAGTVPFTCSLYPAAGNAYARLGAPAGASMAADVAAVKADAAAILTDTGTTLETRQIIIERLLRNRFDTNPITGIATLYADDGTTPLYTANVYEDVAGTMPFDGTGANRRDRLA